MVKVSQVACFRRVLWWIGLSFSLDPSQHAMSFSAFDIFVCSSRVLKS